MKMATLFLVNPISGRGHLDTYARLYSAALLAIGYNIVLIAKTDGGVTDYLERTHPDMLDRFCFISIENAHEFSPALRSLDTATIHRANMRAVARARLVWREEGLIGIMRRAFIIPKRILFKSLPPEFISWLRDQRTGWKLTVYRWLNADVGRFSFIPLMRAIEGAQRLTKQSPDLVINLYLDIMGMRRRSISALDDPSCSPWVGILFHPRYVQNVRTRMEAYFNSTNVRGAIFLVPEAIAPYSAARPDLNFVLAPDVADLELAKEPHELAKAMRRNAGDRKIVLQIGSIAPHKGIITLLDVISEADPKRFFFALIGEVHWESFSADQDRLRAFYASPPENVLIHEGYLGDERDYNTIIIACDMIYAVYENFNSSSNSLTKAAGLRRPILVSRGTLMGDRVTAAGLGIAVRPKDPADILSGIVDITQAPNDFFDYETYARTHSLEQLKAILADAIPKWCRRGFDDTTSTGKKP